MYCPKCGSEENGQFCRKCGAGLQESKRTEEQRIQREKRRKKILIYIGLGLTILLIILGLLFSAGKAIQRSFAKREAKRREAEIVKEEKAAEAKAKAAEAEAKENMTEEEKRNYYYFPILLEYQKAEAGEDLEDAEYVTPHYLKECSFSAGISSGNPAIYAALLDLCGDRSPELFIATYKKDTDSYRIIDMYGFEEGKGSPIFRESGIGYGKKYQICENGKLKQEEEMMDIVRSTAYYRLEKGKTEPVLEEQAYEENGRYYYASASRSEAQEITKTQYEEFMGKYPLLTGVNWNKLSMWECPEQYIQ